MANNSSCVCPGIQSNITNATICNDTSSCFEPVIFFTDVQILYMTILNIIVFLFGILGNILTCSVIIMRQSMRRSIHLYTFNLATSGLLLISVFVPSQVIFMKDQLVWNMGLGLCKISNAVVPVTLHSTIMTLLVITIDRARGLIQPFKWRADSIRTAKITIPIIWVISFVLNTPLFMYPKLKEHSDDGGLTYVTICAENWPNNLIRNEYWIIMFIVMFALPLLVIILTHVMMFVIVLRDKNSIHRKHNRRMIRMVVALVIVFTVCTGFQHVNFFLNTYLHANLTLQDLGLYYSLSNFFVCLQAALNPIIYGTLRRDFKRAFKNVLIHVMVKVKLHKRISRRSQKSFFASKFLNSYVESDQYREIYRRETIRKSRRQREFREDSPMTSRGHSFSEKHNGREKANVNSFAHSPSLFQEALTRSFFNNSYNENSYLDIEKEFGVNLLVFNRTDRTDLPDICTGLPTSSNASDNGSYTQENIPLTEVVKEIETGLNDFEKINDDEMGDEYTQLIQRNKKKSVAPDYNNLLNSVKDSRLSTIMETLQRSPESVV